MFFREPFANFVTKALFGSSVVIAFFCGFYNAFNKKYPPSGNAPMIRRV